MNYKIKYIKSLNNISEQFRDEMDTEDRSNLNSVIGRLFCEIDDDGNMTRELAKELSMESLYKDKLDEFKFKHCIDNHEHLI